MIKSRHDTAALIAVPFQLHPCSINASRKEPAMPETPQTPQPSRTRAVFSPEDFGLIRTAIAHYLREVQDQPESVKYANLYHRRGRVS